MALGHLEPPVRLKVTSLVDDAVHVIVFVRVGNMATSDVEGAVWYADTEKQTSWAVTGWPSCHRRSFLRVKVIVEVAPELLAECPMVIQSKTGCEGLLGLEISNVSYIIRRMLHSVKVDDWNTLR